MNEIKVSRAVVIDVETSSPTKDAARRASRLHNVRPMRH